MSTPSINIAASETRLKNFRLWGALRHIKHHLVVRFAKRQNRVYTQFYRFPHQFRALVEGVVPALRPGPIGPDTPPLDIVIFACCSGEEAFSLSYTLRKHFPGLQYRIRGFDIVSEVVEKARAGVFTREEVYHGPFVTDQFVAETFDMVDGDKMRVKQEIAAPASFAVGSLLDQPFMESLGKVDMALAQNVLFHLPRPQAREAFVHIHGLLKTGGAMFVNGMDMDMRVALTKRLALEPLDYLVEEIHNDARVDRGSGWAGAYWGRKPFTRSGRDWLRRQGTIFLRKD